MTDFLAEDDISDVVCRLNRAKTESRVTLANDHYTHAFIAAGTSLIRSELVDSAGPTDKRRLLSWLSQRAVIAEAQRLGADDANEAKLRDRWKSHGDYIGDLASYVLWSERLRLDLTQSSLAYDRLRNAKADDVVKHIHEVAYSDLTAMVGTAAYRFQLVSAATATSDPVLQAALRQMYDVIVQAWTATYEATISSLGLHLRPDVSMDDLANMLAAVAEGLGLRMLAGADATILDESARTSLLGKAALAIIVSCTATSPDADSLESSVSTLLESTTE